jgi:hypothetical protein
MKKPEHEHETDRKTLNTIAHVTTAHNETATIGKAFGKTNIEPYGTGDKEASVLSHKLSEDSQPREDDGPGRMKTTSATSSPERATEKSSSPVTLHRKGASKDKDTAGSLKHTESKSVTSKTAVKKISKGQTFQATERSRADDIDTKPIAASEESDGSSPSISPVDIPATSPKSVLDKVPRDRSPEYSSEGSLVSELYPRQLSSPVKQLRDVTKQSPDSSPERGNFRPIKCFRTSPEIRPQTLEFAHPRTEAPTEEGESPIEAFKKEPGDDTSDMEDYIETKIIPSTKPSVGKDTTELSEQMFSRDADLKKSPGRVNTTPVFGNDDLSAATGKKTPTSTTGKPHVSSDVPCAQPDTSPTRIRKQRSDESKGKSDQNIRYSAEKRTPDTGTRKHSQESSVPEQNVSVHAVGKVTKLSEKHKQETAETSYSRTKKLPETVGKPKVQGYEIDENSVEQNKETKECSVSPERSLATVTAKITLSHVSPQKQRYSEDKDTKATLNENLGQQFPSYSSPQRGPTKRGTIPKSNHPQKSDGTPFSKPTFISSNMSHVTADKPTTKKSDRSIPSSFHSSDQPKSTSEPTQKQKINKVPASAYNNLVPSRDLSTTQTSKRPSHKSSPSPYSSPDRKPRKGHSSSPDSRRSPSLSPNGEGHPDKCSRSPDTTPSSSPERRKSPEKIRPSGIKTLTKPPCRLVESCCLSSSPEKSTRIPSGSVHASPTRPSRLSSRPDQSTSKSGQSPVRPAQKLSKPNQLSTKTKQSPATSQHVTRTYQSRPHSSPVHSVSRYETEKAKKPDISPVKSAFVRAPRKPDADTHSPKILTEPGHTSDRYTRQESPNKNCEKYVMRISPSVKASVTIKRDPRQQKPDELDEERSTDRSSTVSSPETVKTAGDSIVADTTHIADTQHTTVKSHKRTEVYIPELSHDREPCPFADDRRDKMVSLSALVKAEEIAVSSVTVSALSSKKTKPRDILENAPHVGYNSDDYNEDDLEDESPPEEFLVEDESPTGTLFQSHSVQRKSQSFSEDVPQARTPGAESPKNKPLRSTPASRYSRTVTLPANISRKPTAANKPHGTKQERFVTVVEKRTASISQPKRTSRPLTAIDVRITRSDSKQSPALGGVEPRRQKASVTTVTRSTMSTRQQATVSATRTTKIPAPPTKSTPKKGIYIKDQNRSNGMPKSSVSTTVRNRSSTKTQRIEKISTDSTKKEFVNGISKKPHASSSEDEQEIPEAVSDDEKQSSCLDNEHDDTDNKQYASRLSPARDVPGIVIQPLKSSRESSPEYIRGAAKDGNKPRYADRISEPEDDDDSVHGRHRPRTTVFQKPIVNLEAFDEEYTNDDSKSKFKQRAENSQLKEFTGYAIPHSEQVTDLDEDSGTEEALQTVSVAERVSHFLETTRNVGPTESTQQANNSPDSLDSPSSVRKARAMFENIANSRTSTLKETTRKKDTVSIHDIYCSNSRNSPPLDSRQQLVTDHLNDEGIHRQPENTSSLTTEQFYGKEDNFPETPATKYSTNKSSIIDYHIDTDFHRKSPSPERLAQPCNRPTSGNVNYGTYKKSKPSQESTLRSKTLIAQPEISSDQNDIFSVQGHVSGDILTGVSVQKKQDQSVKDLERSSPSRNDPIPGKETLRDTHPRRQTVIEYFPEDTLLQKFTKDTTTQREILRQKDILNRPSVFEGKHLEQKLIHSTDLEQLNHTYGVKTSGHPDTCPSDYDKLVRSDVKYCTDTFPIDVTSSVTKTYPNQERSEGVYPHDTVTSSRKDVQPRKQFSTDTFPQRMSSKGDTSPTRRHCAPGKPSPVRQDGGPRSRKDFPSRNESYPKGERGPVKTSTALRKDKPTHTESSPTRKYPSPKDTSPATKESYPKRESPRERSPTRSYSSPKDTSPATKESHPKREYSGDSSPTRKYSYPRDDSACRNDLYSKEEYHIRSLTRKFATSRDKSAATNEPRSVRDSAPTSGQSGTDGPMSPRRTSLTGSETEADRSCHQTSSARGSGRFGVNLRHMGSAVSSSAKRHLSAETTTANKKGEEPNIEEIFDLELLERMVS